MNYRFFIHLIVDGAGATIQLELDQVKYSAIKNSSIFSYVPDQWQAWLSWTRAPARFKNPTTPTESWATRRTGVLFSSAP